MAIAALVVKKCPFTIGAKHYIHQEIAGNLCDVTGCKLLTCNNRHDLLDVEFSGLAAPEPQRFHWV